MKFAYRDPRDCTDMLLGHSIAVPSGRLRKGHWLTVQDVDDIIAAQIPQIFAGAREETDVLEDDAAGQIAQAIAQGCETLNIHTAHTGRANLSAICDGIVVYDRAQLIAFNAIDARMTAALLAPYCVVRRGDLIATIKIIPFAVPCDVLTDGLSAIAPTGLVRIAPFAGQRAQLLTTHSVANTASNDKVVNVTRQRLTQVNISLQARADCAHEPDAVANWLKSTARTRTPGDLLLIFGATAVADESDVIPAAIAQAGGRVERVGMAADPGNLLVYGKLGNCTVIGLPGCAKSPALNGFDWVLERCAAGLDISPQDWAEMSVGGLLKEIDTRPQPRRRSRKKTSAERGDAG